MVDSSMFYDKVFTLIDYKGDVARGDKIYSPDYSPNNIKRLLISPSFAIVQYHLPVEGKKINYVRLPSGIYEKVSSEEDYVPMINVLATDRVCASIEEVVIIAVDYNSNGELITLNWKEQNIDGLLKNKPKEKPVEEVVYSRYKRLRDFCLVNTPVNFSSCMTYLKNNADSFFSDLEDGNVSPVYIHKEDWWKQYGFHANYSMDKSGGALNTYFRNIIAEHEKNEKEKEIKKERDARLKEYYDKQDKEIAMYNKFYTAQAILYNCFKNNLMSGISDKYEFSTVKAEIYSNDGVSKSDEKKFNIKDGKDIKEADKIKENISVIHKKSSEIYINILKLFLENMCVLADTKPRTLKMVMDNDVDITINIPSSFSSYNEKIFNVTGKRFEGKEITRSLINVCSLFGELFLVPSSDNVKFKNICRKNFWIEELKGVA